MAARHPGRRGELTIGSKWGYTYVGDWRVDVDVHEVKDHTLATFERQWPETVQALGTPPDLYLVHSLTADSPALDDAALLAGCVSWRRPAYGSGFRRADRRRRRCCGGRWR